MTWLESDLIPWLDILFKLDEMENGLDMVVKEEIKHQSLKCQMQTLSV